MGRLAFTTTPYFGFLSVSKMRLLTHVHWEKDRPVPERVRELGRREMSLGCRGLVLAVSAATWGQDHGAAVAELLPADNDIGDIASLQQGAKYFVNYCLGCHSAQYVRYSRLGEDLGLSDAQVVENLMFGAGQLHDTMVSSMRPEDGAVWFGVAPPDLSLIARSRGVDYLYNYLRGFYADPSRPTGANNLWLENTAMPDVLWELGGTRWAGFFGEFRGWGRHGLAAIILKSSARDR